MAIRAIRFAREKYGRTCLGDAGDVAALPGFIDHSEPHALHFYELMIVREGAGELLLDGATHAVRPLAGFVTLPAQVRSWRLRGRLRAEVVFFERDWMSAAASALDLHDGTVALPGSALPAMEQIAR